jgi:dTDP-4-amino-4,6-dideoxygalactose transaminase
MRADGIGVQVNYVPVYWHPAFEDLGYRRGMCPVAEAFYAQELSLPLFVDLSDADQDRVVETLRRILGS